MHLNRWQRLWIIVTIAWAVTVGAAYFSFSSSDEKRQHEWANELISYLVERSPDLRGHTLVTLRATYSDMTDKQLIDALHERYLPKHPAYRYGFAEIDARYAIDREPRRLAEYLAAVLGIPVVIYLAGLAITWVRRGV